MNKTPVQGDKQDDWAQVLKVYDAINEGNAPSLLQPPYATKPITFGLEFEVHYRLANERLDEQGVKARIAYWAQRLTQLATPTAAAVRDCINRHHGLREALTEALDQVLRSTLNPELEARHRPLALGTVSHDALETLWDELRTTLRSQRVDTWLAQSERLPFAYARPEARLQGRPFLLMPPNFTLKYLFGFRNDGLQLPGGKTFQGLPYWPEDKLPNNRVICESMKSSSSWMPTPYAEEVGLEAHLLEWDEDLPQTVAELHSPAHASFSHIEGIHDALEKHFQGLSTGPQHWIVVPKPPRTMLSSWSNATSNLARLYHMVMLDDLAAGSEASLPDLAAQHFFLFLDDADLSFPPGRDGVGPRTRLSGATPRSIIRILDNPFLGDPQQRKQIGKTLDYEHMALELRGWMGDQEDRRMLVASLASRLSANVFEPWLSAQLLPLIPNLDDETAWQAHIARLADFLMAYGPQDLEVMPAELPLAADGNQPITQDAIDRINEARAQLQREDPRELRIRSLSTLRSSFIDLERAQNPSAPLSAEARSRLVATLAPMSGIFALPVYSSTDGAAALAQQISSWNAVAQLFAFKQKLTLEETVRWTANSHIPGRILGCLLNPHHIGPAQGRLKLPCGTAETYPGFFGFRDGLER